MTALSTLVLSLPTRNSTIRMRVWRALKEIGCAVLRDGVYVLPTGARGAPVLAAMESEIRAAGGFAMTLDLNLKTPAQLAHVRKLFDRSAEYGALVQELGAARASLPARGLRKAQTIVRRLQRSLEKLTEIDFFPDQANLQAAEAIAALKLRLQELYSGGEPHPSRKQLRRLDASKYQQRVWATRKHPWVDRLASAWLIKRFIDREARFVWIDSPRHRPGKAIGFDFDGAAFTHAGNRVTFEVLLTSFGLENDAALASIGAAVHFLDTGGVPVADAKGMETVLGGIRAKAKTDDELLAESMAIFDLFYSAYAQGKKEGTA
ncbi:MAG TPA: chromate resistance protein ChrB domain-containing protein [Burkholderiales bacterium]|nr:chromate resistance protein ChrB domain-containing protein [Burkholderiales bacterium]